MAFSPERPESRGGWRVVLIVALGCVAATRAGASEPTFYAERVAPILERHCVSCHGADEQEAKLRLDGFEHVIRGSDAGSVVTAGDAKRSELFRRIILPADDPDVMPADGKPLLSPNEITVLRLWIERGASPNAPLSAFPDAPQPKAKRENAPAAPDWRPQAEAIAAFQRATGIKLVPRSQIPTDGLILRTASSPQRCDDAALARLGGLAPLVVEAELARTRITDAGLAALSRCENLRVLDLTRTVVTSAGVAKLAMLPNLEALNLTETAVDEAGLAVLESWPALQRWWAFRAGAARSNPPGL